MNEEIRWLVNDRKVDDLRDRMIKARNNFRKNNLNATEEMEERFLDKTFMEESKGLMKEQMGIIASGLKR